MSKINREIGHLFPIKGLASPPCRQAGNKINKSRPVTFYFQVKKRAEKQYFI